jgi:putative flippase GtrA
VQAEGLRRWFKFNAVGLAGVAVQSAALLLLLAAGVHYLVATWLAVESAILHNFAWHRRWTWRERSRPNWLRALLRFHTANGAVSLAGNLIVMRLLAGGAGWPPWAANLASIGLCSFVNFWAAGRWVFPEMLYSSRGREYQSYVPSIADYAGHPAGSVPGGLGARQGQT